MNIVFPIAGRGTRFEGYSNYPKPLIYINNKSISDIYEYMDRLTELEKGMTVPVVIERDGKELSVPVTF